MKFRITLGFLGLLLFVGALFLCVSISPSQYGDTYSGKTVFETEAEYGDFKRAIGSEMVEIEKITVLSSSLPIVVDFKVDTPYDYAFGYGTVSRSGRIVSNYIMGGLVGVVGIALFWIVGLQKPKRWFGERQWIKCR